MPCAGQADSRDQRMPVEVELSDHATRPSSGAAASSTDSATVCSSVFGVARYGNTLMPGFVAPVAPPCRNSRSRLTSQVSRMSIDVRVDRAAAARLVGTAVERALLDLEVAVVGDRLGDIEQQKIVEEDIRVGGERVRRPIGLAVAHVPDLRSCPSGVAGTAAAAPSGSRTASAGSTGRVSRRPRPSQDC